MTTATQHTLATSREEIEARGWDEPDIDWWAQTDEEIAYDNYCYYSWRVCMCCYMARLSVPLL